jgi:uncharacterized protein YndB with AHSA1/START domain
MVARDASPWHDARVTSVERTIRVAAPPEQVWAAFCDEATLSAWFGGDARLDIRPGGRGRFTGPAGDVRLAAVDEVEPYRHLAWRWWPLGCSPLDAGTVAFDLEGLDGDDGDEVGTQVTVREEPPARRAAMSVLAGASSG